MRFHSFAKAGRSFSKAFQSAGESSFILLNGTVSLPPGGATSGRGE